MKKPLALVDLDGTLADFQGAMRRDLIALRAPEEPGQIEWDDEHQPPHIKARWSMIKRQPDWWFNLEYMPSGQFLVEALKEAGFKLHILSRAPRKLPSAWEQKVRWVMKHVPDADLTLTPFKGNFYGKLLVDDWPDYVRPWLEHRPRGMVIMPDQPWNRTEEMLEHPRIIRHEHGKNDAAVKVAMKEHFESIKEIR
jgi:5'-nucleotidase